MIEMVSSGNVEKDFEAFFGVLVEKYNIQNQEGFKKDFFEYLSRTIKPEFNDPNNLANFVTQNPKELEKITKEFFDIVNKHSAGFDFYEGATTEIEILKKKIQDK